MPVAVFVAVTVTPGIKALVESETVPPRVAFVVCANVFVKKTQSSIAAIKKSLFMILPHTYKSRHLDSFSADKQRAESLGSVLPTASGRYKFFLMEVSVRDWMACPRWTLGNIPCA